MLKKVIRAMTGRQISKPEIIIPARKSLPIIVNLTKDVLHIDNRYNSLKEELDQRENDRRCEQERSGVSDRLSHVQSPIAPILKVGLRIDMLFNHGKNENDENILMWSQCVIWLVSDGKNMPKESGGFHKKRDCIVIWDPNVERGELNSESVVSLPLLLHNKQLHNSWIVYLA